MHISHVVGCIFFKAYYKVKSNQDSCATCKRADIQVDGIEQRVQINRGMYLWSIDFNQDA